MQIIQSNNLEGLYDEFIKLETANRPNNLEDVKFLQNHSLLKEFFNFSFFYDVATLTKSRYRIKEASYLLVEMFALKDHGNLIENDCSKEDTISYILGSPLFYRLSSFVVFKKYDFFMNQ